MRLRRWLGDSVAGRAMDCFYCMSLWLAAPIAFALTRQWLAGQLLDGALLWLALSGGACLLERATAPRRPEAPPPPVAPEE